MTYSPLTPEDIRSMLGFLNRKSIDELFAGAVPADDLINEPLNLPDPLSEPEMVKLIETLSAQNTGAHTRLSFMGAGAYSHYIPAVVREVVSRPEFFTAYTPYQPEVSQGTLASIFEFQTFIAELTGLDVANASLYDGATALAEAVLMAARLKPVQNPVVLIHNRIHPWYLDVLKTYAGAQRIRLVFEPDGVNSTELIAVVAQNPDFYGRINDYTPAIEYARRHDALSVVVHEPHSLGILTPPGSLGADVCVGDATALGNPLSFGGPLLGYMAVRDQYTRQVPGRLIGETVDVEGRRAFVMTLQTREQHIRRERATSNICTNEALCALAATVYLSWLGPEGFTRLARTIFDGTNYAARLFAEKFELPVSGPFFKDFVVRLPGRADEFFFRMFEQHNILPGVPAVWLDPAEDTHNLIVSVTELHTRDDIAELVELA